MLPVEDIMTYLYTVHFLIIDKNQMNSDYNFLQYQQPPKWPERVIYVMILLVFVWKVSLQLHIISLRFIRYMNYQFRKIITD